MNKIDNIVNIRINNPKLYDRLMECDCQIFVNHVCVYEGKYDRKFGTSLENPENALVIFDLGNSYAMMTITENKSLSKIIDIFNENQNDIDKIMTDHKLYNKLMNLQTDIPEFPTIYEGNNIERMYRFLKEDEDESIPGDGLPDKDEKEDKEKLKRRGDIQFTIWESPKKKVTWLDNNKDYQKIEYIYENKPKGLSIDFLLGFKNGSWRLWAGKPGVVSYDDDEYKNLKEEKFSKAIVMALDKVEEMIDEIENNPDDWAQFYINI